MASVPRARARTLTAYVIGPGFGESVVIVLPGGEVVVVDSCRRDGANLTVALLGELEVEAVDLLVVTHPDLDHIGGLPELVRRYPPRRAWRYPFGASLRELVARWIDRDEGDGRLAEVNDAMAAIEELEEQNRCMQAAYRQTWKAPSGACAVECVAPSSHDVVRARRRLRDLVRQSGDDYELASWLRAYLTRGRASLGDRPNLVSLALVVRWNDRKILLAGDVEASSKNLHSGWAGMLGSLEEDGELDLVRDCDAVKVAHHGSIGALHHPAWELHGRGDSSTVLAVAPFHRGHLLPDGASLEQLRRYAGALGLTSDHGSFVRAANAGWSARSATPAGVGPIVVVEVTETGPATIQAASEAAVFA